MLTLKSNVDTSVLICYPQTFKLCNFHDFKHDFIISKKPHVFQFEFANMVHAWYTTRNLASFYLQKSMWSFYPSIPPVNGGECMCCENVVLNKVPSFS